MHAVRTLWLFASLSLMAAAPAVSGCTPPAKVAAPAVKRPEGGDLRFAPGPHGKLRYLDCGEGGTPVLFVHGLAGNYAVWLEQVRHLCKSRRVLALELHGYGQSEPSKTGDYSIDSFAADVAALADDLKLEPFVIAGHSMGGAVVGDYAGKHPERLKGLLLVDAVGDLSRLSAKDKEDFIGGFRGDRYEAERDAFFTEMLKPAPASVKQLVMEGVRAATRDVVVKSLEGMTAYDPIPALTRYPGPRLAVFGDGNDDGTSLQRMLPDLANRKMPNVSHWIMLDDPAAFNVILDGFLASTVTP